MKKHVIFLCLLLIMFLLSSCSLNVVSFEDVMKENEYYVETLNINELDLIYNAYLKDSTKYEKNSLPVTICLVSTVEQSINVQKIIEDPKSIDYSTYFNKNFVGLAIDYNNVINAEVAYGLKDELIKSIKENNEVINEDIFNMSIKKIGSTIFYGTEEFIKIVSEN